MRILLVLLFCFGLTSQAMAHRQPESLTQFEVQEIKNGMVLYGVTYRLHAHDAIEILSHLGHQPDLEDADNQQVLLTYAEKASILKFGEYHLVARELGVQVDAGFVYIFQEFSLPVGLNQMQLQLNSQLLDFKNNWRNAIETPNGSFLTHKDKRRTQIKL